MNLRDARTRLGLGVSELAAVIGVSRNTVARWESGSAMDPRHAELVEVVIRLADQPEANAIGARLRSLSGLPALRELLTRGLESEEARTA